MIYDYLFYNSYQLAKKSKNWEDTPILFAVMIVGSCFIANLFTLKFIIDVFWGDKIFFKQNLESLKYIIASILCLFLVFYYTYKGRGEKIVAKYDTREKEGKRKVHPLLPVLLYLLLSIVLMFLIGMYKHQYWIFSRDA